MQTVCLQEREARVDETEVMSGSPVARKEKSRKLPGYVSWSLALVGPYVSIIGLLVLSSMLAPTSQWAYLPMSIVLMFVLFLNAIEKKNEKIWCFIGIFCALNLWFFTFTCGVLSATISKAFSTNYTAR